MFGIRLACGEMLLQFLLHITIYLFYIIFKSSVDPELCWPLPLISTGEKEETCFELRRWSYSFIPLYDHLAKRTVQMCFMNSEKQLLTL